MQPKPDGQADGTDGGPDLKRDHSSIEVVLSIGVLVFGLIVLGLETFILRPSNSYTAFWALKLYGVTLVIIAGMFMIVAGYSQSQITSMMGLLGSLAGYLLGKENKSASSSPTPQPAPQDKKL
jgi:thiol:disulfide interchange protein